jgi:hypothetical protein
VPAGGRRAAWTHPVAPVRGLTAPASGAAAPAAERYKGIVRWLLLAPLVMLLNVILVLACLTHVNRFAGSRSAFERLVGRSQRRRVAAV